MKKMYIPAWQIARIRASDVSKASAASHYSSVGGGHVFLLELEAVAIMVRFFAQTRVVFMFW